MGALPRPTPRNGSTVKADDEEPPRARPTPRNGSTAKANTKEWEHHQGRRRGMGAPPRPTPRNGSTAEADAEEWEHRQGRRRGMGAPPRPTPRTGLARRRKPAPRNSKDGGTKRQPTINKKWSDRKKERMKRLVEAAGTQTMTMAKQNEANRRRRTIPSKNDNQPDRNGGDLLCDGRQPLSVALDPPNSPSSIFEVAEVVENRKMGVLEKVSWQETKKVLYVEHSTSLQYRCKNENPTFCQKVRMLRRLLLGSYVWSQSRQYLTSLENLRLYSIYI
jgi:hypothetical protein